jgi:uncharacterized protein (TIGR02271 family)
MPKSRSSSARSPALRANNKRHAGTRGREDESSAALGDAIVVPRVEEQLEIHKEKRATGRVKVQIVPRVRTERVDLVLENEEVEIKRVPVNRVVDAPSPMRQEGDVTILPVYEEITVVEKKLVLKEEVHITRRRKQKHETQQLPVRSEEVKITRFNSPP